MLYYQMQILTMKMFGIKPVIAMISYANFGSSKSPEARKVREAVSYLHKMSPETIVDGELQGIKTLPNRFFKLTNPYRLLIAL